MTTTTADQDDDRIAAVAKALAHPARLRILRLLGTTPGCLGGDIVQAVGLAQSTVSEHLRILKAAGLVVGDIEPPRVCYSLSPEALQPIADLVTGLNAMAGNSGDCVTPDQPGIRS